MKVILSNYDSPQNPFYAGGGAIAVHKLASHLAKKNDVTVLCGKYPYYKDYESDGVVYKHIGIASGGAKLGQLIYFAKLPYVVLTNVFDVWVESFTPPFSAAVLPFFTKKPVIGLIHMLTGEDMKRKYKLPFPLIEKLGVKTYKNVIVTTKEIEAKIASFNKKADIIVIPNGIDLPKKITKRKKKHILFIGRIEVNQKGLDLLLEAYKKVEAKVKYPLIIAGTGENREIQELKKLIAKLGLSKKVRLVGYIKNERKQKLLEEALFLAIPSRFETFCMTVLDAFAYSVPVVIFDIEGLTWVPKKFSAKVSAFSIEEYAKAIKKMSNDDMFRKNMAKEIHGYAKQFQWKYILEKYEKYINTVAKTHEKNN